MPRGFQLRPLGSGQRLPEPVQRKMEAAFGADFSSVRVHVGPEAASIGALAFTVGSDLYFAPGQYNPGSPHGQRLIGHELTHVVQQRAGRVRNPLGSGMAVVQDAALEAEAERMALATATAPAAIQSKPARTMSGPLVGRPTLPPGKGSGPVQAKGGPGFSILPSGPGRDGRWQLKAISGKTSIGSVEIRPMSAGGVEIENLRVLQEYRRKGVGRELVKAALASARVSGAGVARLEARPSDRSVPLQALVSLYQSQGFRPVGLSVRGNPLMEAGIAAARPAASAKVNSTKTMQRSPSPTLPAWAHRGAGRPSAPPHIAHRFTSFRTIQRMEQKKGNEKTEQKTWRYWICPEHGPFDNFHPVSEAWCPKCYEEAKPDTESSEKKTTPGPEKGQNAAPAPQDGLTKMVRGLGLKFPTQPQPLGPKTQKEYTLKQNVVDRLNKLINKYDEKFTSEALVDADDAETIAVQSSITSNLMLLLSYIFEELPEEDEEASETLQALGFVQFLAFIFAKKLNVCHNTHATSMRLFFSGVSKKK